MRAIWQTIRNWFTAGRDGPRSAPQQSTPQFKWYDVGPENPFPVRVLDVRPLTQTLMSTTTDPAVAQSYVRLRTSDGKELVDAKIPNSVWIPASLRFPHNGNPLGGVAFKADSMDVRWDIYVYDSIFLFARSWTGDLVYRARATIGQEIVISEIECSTQERDIAPSHVFFLLASHAMRRILPHRIPSDTPMVDEKIAVRSFSLFGNFANYATFDDITGIKLEPTRPDPE